jgi:predicted ATPase
MTGMTGMGRFSTGTHSSILLRSIQTLVATGKLPPELVKLHWFTRNPQDGSTEIHSADLDEQGAFGDWPQDFDEVALEMEKQYLDAADQDRSHH